MTEMTMPDAYGELIEPTTLRMQRRLPGPIERVWSYLTDSELRRTWLAAGDMTQGVGAPFELVWRNDQLSDPPGERPEGFAEEHRMQSRLVVLDPPHRLVFAWGNGGEVSFELEPKGDHVLLTLIHRRLADRITSLNIGAGWHAHLDILVARAGGQEPGPFWDAWSGLREDYDRRMPA